MIGDEFVQVEYEPLRQFVAEFKIAPGLSQDLTAWLDRFDTSRVNPARVVSYTSYVDVMGHVAQPMLVAIVTGTEILQEDSSGDSDSEPSTPDASPAEDVHGHAD